MVSAHLCWLALFYRPKIFFGKEKESDRNTRTESEWVVLGKKRETLRQHTTWGSSGLR